MQCRVRRRVRAATLAAALVLCAPAPSRGKPAGPVVEPIDIGFTERTGRSLLFLDVEAVDDDGLPMTGLQKADFKIRVNYSWRKIYSVDDLCPCGPAAADGETASAVHRALLAAPPHFVLYFDFSQLQQAGREQALVEARRWAAEVMQPGDRVMVVAFSSEAGLRRLSELTADREQILGAIEAAGADPELVDAFPDDRRARQQMCDDGTLSCYNVGRQEYRHARRSLETLRNFLTELDGIPARKTLLLFHENASIFPGRLYGQGAGYLPQNVWDRLESLREPDFDRKRAFRENSALVPDLLELSQEVGGSATASRTVVFPLACGSARTWTVNLGANLADNTGGEYNRRTDELTELLSVAGRRCACIYRIGLEMEDPRRSFVLRTKVKARGRPLPSRYMVEYLTDADRWMRRAQLVLANPESWTDIAVGAGVVPLRAKGSKWQARIEVGLDLSELRVALTDDDEQAAEWEVAALLSDADGNRHWEMLGVYRASPDSSGGLDAWMLHEHSIPDLRPGRYELRAFVHDRADDRYGTATAEIELPQPGRAGLAGPLAQLPERAHLLGDLPLREKNIDAGASPASTATGPMPLGDRAIVIQGEPLQFSTLVCAAGRTEVRSAVRSERDERSFEGRVETVEPEASGCAPLVQSIDTWGLEPGRYSYRLEWDEQPQEALAWFEVRRGGAAAED